MNTNNSSSEKYELRHTFVAMLFALVIGQLAITLYITINSIFVDPNTKISWPAKLPALIHLLLALVVITSSWVDWSKTFKSGNIPKLEMVFSRAYLLLMIDILILFLYFSLVKSVDLIDHASGYSESLIMLGIFISYFLWDLAFNDSNYSFAIKIINVLPSLFSSMLCLVLFLLVKYDSISSWLTIDVLLFFIIIGFRWIKRMQVKYVKNQIDNR